MANIVCHKIDSSPDGLAYVASDKEVWVTTPRDKSIRVLDGKTLDEKAKFTLDGSPEGFAVDAKLHRFYTNLEDKDLTLAIDVASRKTVATWKSSGGEKGPRGSESTRTPVSSSSCTVKVEVRRRGARREVLRRSIRVKAWTIDYAPATHRPHVGRQGWPTHGRDRRRERQVVDRARVPTHVGARNPAVTDKGVVFQLTQTWRPHWTGRRDAYELAASR